MTTVLAAVHCFTMGVDSLVMSRRKAGGGKGKGLLFLLSSIIVVSCLRQVDVRNG
jgi:hypothetical protein